MSTGERPPVEVDKFPQSLDALSVRSDTESYPTPGFAGVLRWSDVEQPLPLDTMSSATQDTTVAPPAGGLSSPAAVARFTRNLDAFVSEHLGEAVPLDLRVAMQPQWGAVFANLLAGHYADLPLKVEMPSERKGQMQLARANVCFALSRHLRTAFDDGGAAKHFLARWQEDWEPGDVQQPLFKLAGAVDENLEPSKLAHELVAYLNPDRSSRVQAAEDRDSVVRPWLSDLINRPDVKYREWREEFYSNVSLSTMELLDNISSHSRLAEGGLCSLSLFTTTGGVGGANDKLYVSVWDNGCGMHESIAEHFEHATPALDMVTSPFNAEMPHRQADRGRGLHRVSSIVNRTGGDLFVATGPVEGGSVVIKHHGSADARVTGSIEPLPVQGTVIVMTLPLRPEAS